MWRSNDWSTDLEISRPDDRSMCTTTCTSPGLRAGRPDGRPIQRVHSLDLALVDRAADWPESFRSWPGCGWPGGQPAAPTVINMTVGRSTSRSTDRSSGLQIWPQRLYFWTLYKGAILASLYKILREFLSQFFLRFSKIVQQVLEIKFYFKRSVYKSDSLVFFKRISWVFPPQIYLSFSHKSLNFSLTYLSYRSFVVKVFLMIKV